MILVQPNLFVVFIDNAPGSILHKVPVTIVPKDQCENNLKQTHLGKYFKLNEGFSCAAPISEAELCKVSAKIRPCAFFLVTIIWS